MFVSFPHRFLGFCCCLLALSACRDGLEPSYIPSGYTYHGQAYNSPPGPDAKSIGYKYSSEVNDEVLQSWRVQVGKMIDQLEADTGLSAQKVYVEPLPYMNAFNASYDHIVRESFAQHGYSIADKSCRLQVRYESFRLKDEGARHPYPFEENLNGDNKGSSKTQYYADHQSPFVFIMTAKKDGEVIGQVRRENTMPAYGYVTDEGQRVPEERLRL